jgi:hypothetical protein
VRHHLEHIYRQLGVNSRIAAAHIATRTLSGYTLADGAGAAVRGLRSCVHTLCASSATAA